MSWEGRMGENHGEYKYATLRIIANSRTNVLCISRCGYRRGGATMSIVPHMLHSIMCSIL